MHALSDGTIRRRPRWRVLLGLLACCAFAALGPARAQQASATPDAGDPPTRVARLSYIAGDVGFLPAGTSDWRDVSVNRPLTRDDRLSTGVDSRAELDLGSASLRMDSQTDFGFLDLSDWQVQVELTQGSVELSVRDIPDGQDYEIDTPAVALVVDRPGNVRVDIGSDGTSTTVSVRRGSAVVYGQDGARQVLQAGSRYRFTDATLAGVQVGDIGGADAFDTWCSARDRRYADSISRQYVSADTIGYQDLDAYGNWRSEADYGEVWFPDDVGTDWAPYRDGHWAWIAPWGWTWVDDAPWGFAPFHYGRWAVIGGNWGWIPGPVGLRAVYAPALVTFFGGSHWGVSVGVGIGPVGWFPLGPGAIYDPWYRASRRYYARVNRSNICVRNRDQRRRRDRRIDTDYSAWRKPERLRHVHYLGQHTPRGATVVSGHVLSQGRGVRRARLHVAANHFRRAPLLHHGIGLRPDWRHLAKTRPVPAHALPLGGFKRQVVARHLPLRPAVATRAMAHQRTATHGRPTAAPWHPRVRLLAGAADVRAGGRAPKAAVRRWHPSRVAGTPAARSRAPVELRSADFAHARAHHRERAEVPHAGRMAKPAARMAKPVTAAPMVRPAARMARPAMRIFKPATPAAGTLPRVPRFHRAAPATRIVHVPYRPPRAGAARRTGASARARAAPRFTAPPVRANHAVPRLAPPPVRPVSHVSEHRGHAAWRSTRPRPAARPPHPMRTPSRAVPRMVPRASRAPAAHAPSHPKASRQPVWKKQH